MVRYPGATARTTRTAFLHRNNIGDGIPGGDKKLDDATAVVAYFESQVHGFWLRSTASAGCRKRPRGVGSPAGITDNVYPRPAPPMPESGDPCPGFIAEAGRCWQNVYGIQLQADALPRSAGMDRPLALAPR